MINYSIVIEYNIGRPRNGRNAIFGKKLNFLSIPVHNIMRPGTALWVLASCSLVFAQAPVTLHTTTVAPPPQFERINIRRIVTRGGHEMQSDGPNGPPTAKVNPVARQAGNCKNVRYPATAVGQTALIRSPNWPNAYPPSQDCSYFVSSPNGTEITLSCDVNIACASPNDYIFWSLSGDPKFGDAQGYCGQGRITLQTSQANSLSIGFHSEVGRRPPSRVTYRWQCRIRIINAPTPPSTTTARPNPTTTRRPVPPTTTTPSPITPPPGATNCSCGVRNPQGVGRIVGGTQTQTNELPWRVTVFVSD